MTYNLEIRCILGVIISPQFMLWSGVTPTLIICNNIKFRKNDGRKTPSERYHYCYIEVLTPELLYKHRQEVMRKHLIQQVKNIQIDKLTNDQLQQIVQITQIPNSNEDISKTEKMVP